MPEFTYTYDPRLKGGSYRNDQTGRIVSLVEVREALDTAVDSSIDGTKQLAGLLRERKINIAEWQTQMRNMIKSTQINAALIANGGYDSMSPADWGRVGQRIKVQYQELDSFAKQVENGIPLDGRFVVRCTLYNDAAIPTYEEFARLKFRATFDEERNILDPGAKHCEGCLEEAAKDWVPIGELVPIGGRDCLTRDRCMLEYRNSVTGETTV